MMWDDGRGWHMLGRGPGRWGMYDGWGYAGPGMLLVVVLVAALVGLLVWVLLRAARPAPRPDDLGPGAGPARQILEERFARGEIDEEEFRARREALISG